MFKFKYGVRQNVKGFHHQESEMSEPGVSSSIQATIFRMSQPKQPLHFLRDVSIIFFLIYISLAFFFCYLARACFVWKTVDARRFFSSIVRISSPVSFFRKKLRQRIGRIYRPFNLFESMRVKRRDWINFGITQPYRFLLLLYTPY